MKKILIIMAVVLAMTSCVSNPPPPEPTPAPATVAPFEILQHKGTTLGVTTVPGWVAESLNGPKAIEKLPDYKDKYVVIVDIADKSLQAIQLAADNLNAPAAIARYLSTRVKDTFAGAQVGDLSSISTYMERVVKLVSEATFSGFEPGPDWWVQIRWYKPDGKKTFDHDEFRFLKIYSIDKKILMTQLEAIMSGAKAEEVKTPEQTRATDLAQQAFYDGF